MHKNSILLIILLLFNLLAHGSYNVYLVHGFGGIGIEMKEIQKAIEKEGYKSEIFIYQSMVNDVDSVANRLFEKIQEAHYDTVSFVTHSMGALVVRSMYEHLDSSVRFPFIHRIVMIAPPNNGSPVADFFAHFAFVKDIMGPNVNNLTTNPLTGAGKYPIPTCEVGLIAGSYGSKRGFNIFVEGDNDGVLRPEQTKLGIEKDVVFVKSSHVGLLFNKKVIRYVIRFLNDGTFGSRPRRI
jgi:uncharacterized alpha/beta hydrolase family protein